MDSNRLAELHALALPLAAKVRALDGALAAWRPKQDIRAELGEAKAAHKAIVDEIAGILTPDDAP